MCSILLFCLEACLYVQIDLLLDNPDFLIVSISVVLAHSANILDVLAILREVLVDLPLIVRQRFPAGG